MQQSDKPGRVLIIAGSDSGGGAGIQADIKAVSAMGAYPMTAITAVTVQNTHGVSAIHPVPNAIVEGQIRAVLDDIGADTVKTGMLATAEVVELVAGILEGLETPLPLVLDPVMVSTSGHRLVDDGTEAAIRTRLLPLAALVTPNIPEAARLTGESVEDLGGQIAAAEALIAMGAKAALVKGGHLDCNVVSDVLVSTRGMEIMERPRIRTRHTHGTGCTLASAIAARLAGGEPLPEAVRTAGDYLHEAIARAPGLGGGNGPVDHMWVLRP